MCITPPTVPECMWTLQLLNQCQRFAFISAINELLAESWSCKFLVIGPIYVTVTLVICWPTEESLLNLNLCWCDFMMTHRHYKVNDSDLQFNIVGTWAVRRSDELQTNNQHHCGCILPSENFIMEQGNRWCDLMQELFFISYTVVTNSLIFICICVNCLVSLCLLFGILLERSLFLLSRES